MNPTLPSSAEMPDVQAGSVPVNVVAVKWPGHWIIRAIGVFSYTNDDLRSWIEPFVMLSDGPLEWRHHQYHIPHYLAYGDGDLPRWGWPPQGVFLFRYQGNYTYGPRAEKLRGTP